MPANRKPKAWNLKPQLTAAPELWRGMTSAGAVWEGDGAPFDIQARKYPVLSGSPNFISSSVGRAIIFNDGVEGETLQMNHLAGVLDGISAFTYSIYARFDGSASVDEDTLGLQWSVLQGATDSNATRVLFRYDSVNSQLDLFLDTTGGVGSLTRTVSIDDGKFYLITAWWDGATARILVDGETQGAGQSISGPLKSAATTKIPEIMGGHNVTGPLGTTGSDDSPRFTLAAWTLHVGKALNLDLIKAQARDPFIMLRPAGF